MKSNQENELNSPQVLEVNEDEKFHTDTDWMFQKASPLEAKAQGELTDKAAAEFVALQEAHERELAETALNILKTGIPLMELKAGYSINHFGNDEVLKAVVFAACLQSSCTTKGLQIYVNGEKGSGKSSALRAAIHILPPTAVINSSFSSKALFYEELISKTIIVLDDSDLKEDHVTLLKRCITNFQTETHHKTVINHKLVKQKLPSRMLWLGTSVLEEGDDQFRDRFVSITIKNSKLDNDDYVKWELDRRGQGRLEVETTRDVEVARAIMQHIRDKEFIVEGIDKIRFAYTWDRRLINIFLDLVEASAILHYLQREHTEVPNSNLITVTPNQMDIQNAMSFSFFNHLDPAAEGRLTTAQIALNNMLQEALGKTELREFTESEIASMYKKSVQSIRKLLYGKDGNRNDIKAGLCSNAYWIRPAQSELQQKTINVVVVQKHVSDMKSDFAWFESEPETK